MHDGTNFLQLYPIYHGIDPDVGMYVWYKCKWFRYKEGDSKIAQNLSSAWYMYAFPLSDGTLPFKVHPVYSHQGSTFQQIVTLLYFQKLDWYLDSDDFHVSNIFYQVRLDGFLHLCALRVYFSPLQWSTIKLKHREDHFWFCIDKFAFLIWVCFHLV